MKIYALDSDNEEFQSLINSLAEKISIDLFDDFDTMLNELEEDCQGMLFDFDHEARKKNKFITKIKKQVPDMQIFLLANTLDAKKLAKHQKSKTGAHLYFQTPVDEDLLESMLEPFIDFAESEEMGAMNEDEIISEHVTKTKISKDATDVSETLDGAFSGAFIEEYVDDDLQEKQSDEPSAGDLSEISLDQADEPEVKMEEVSMDEVSMDEVGLDEVSLDAEVEELSLGADDEGLSLTEDVDDVSLDEVSLDEDDSKESSDGGDDWSDNEELSLGSDEEGENEETLFPDEDDLSFPDMDLPDELKSTAPAEALAAAGNSESGVEEMELSDEGDLLELGGDDDLVSEPQDSGDDFAMDLGGEELSLGGDESDGVSLDEGTTPSQVFDLSADEETSQADSGVSLGSEEEDELAAAINSANEMSGLEDELQINENEDEELTRPTMDIETNELQASSSEDLSASDFAVKIESKFDDSGQDDIDALLNQPASTEENEFNAPLGETQLDMPKSEESQIIEAAKDMTNTGLTIQVVAIPSEQTGDDDEELEEPTGITMAHPPEEGAVLDLTGDDDASSDVTETKTSIALDQGTLSSYDLPESPDFSETVEKKLQEIDNMIDDQSDYDEDHTVVVNPSELETNIYATQGISDDTTVVQPNPMTDEAPAQRAPTPVPQDLKEEHRSYVQSRDEELVRLGETIKQLRADREEMANKIADFESKKEGENRKILDLQAELDEKNIELIVIKKRMEKQIDDLKFQLDIAVDKKEILAKQNDKNLQELENLSRQKKLDVNKIRARERELEERLEMLRTDAEIQIRNRDQKILDLKRRIDTLEFDIESSHMKEKQSKTQQVDLQDKMDRVIKTLRGAIGQLEDDYGAEERQKSVKKNLDI